MFFQRHKARNEATREVAFHVHHRIKQEGRVLTRWAVERHMAEMRLGVWGGFLRDQAELTSAVRVFHFLNSWVVWFR